MGKWTRGFSIVAVGMTSALLLSACGGGSAAQSEAQNLTAGIAAQNAGDYATATQDYNKVIAADPQNATAMYDLGDVDQLQNLDADARARYLAALAIDPKHGAWLTPGGVRRTLPQTASLKLVAISSQARKADKGAIRFDPDGSSSGGRIELTEGKRRMQIGIDWLTGRVSVASGP